jgi:hypothetical protein
MRQICVFCPNLRADFVWPFAIVSAMKNYALALGALALLASCSAEPSDFRPGKKVSVDVAPAGGRTTGLYPSNDIAGKEAHAEGHGAGHGEAHGEGHGAGHDEAHGAGHGEAAPAEAAPAEAGTEAAAEAAPAAPAHGE